MFSPRAAVRIVLATILLPAASTAFAADSQDDAVDAEFERLVSATTLRCTAGPGASAEWTSGKPNVKPSSWGRDNVFHFDQIDLKAGKARMIGNAGAADVRAFFTPVGVNFLEGTPAGNVILSTVFAWMMDGKFPFVMSRHLNMMGGPLTSQYAGSCERLGP